MMNRPNSYVADQSVALSIGPPLADERGLGALSLPGFLRETCNRQSGREALVLCEGSERLTWSYDQLYEHSMAVARSLIAYGTAKGERVGILMTNRPEFIAAVFGVALAGGVATPFSTFSTAPELEYFLAASGCSTLLMERYVLKKDFVRMLCEIEPLIESAQHGRIASTKFPFLRRIAAIGEQEETGVIESWGAFLSTGSNISTAAVEACAATVKPADPGVLFFSSGSTSKPKGILSTHRGVAIQMWRMVRQQGLDRDVRYWTANGFFWSGNFAMVVGAVLAVGGTLVLQRIFQPEEALALMEAEKVSFLFAWPHQWEQLTGARNWSQVDLSALRYIDRNSPIAAHPTVQSDWLQPNYAYGNTETFTLTTAYPANTPQELGRESHGLPLPGNRIKIVDPLTDCPVAVGDRGEIAVKGPTLMLGYIGASLDDTLDSEGFFRTGDGGYIDAEGRLFWEGRLSDIIKTGGANVSPLEIDEAIQRLEGVKITQTVGIPHDTLGEIVVTCIVTHAGAILNEKVVRAFAKERLASYKVPRRVLFFEDAELQLTGSAKVKTADLRAIVAQRLND